jgi:hypothetical protein
MRIQRAARWVVLWTALQAAFCAICVNSAWV